MDIADYKIAGGGTWRSVYSSGYQRVSGLAAGANVFNVTASAGQVVVLHALVNITGSGNYKVKRDGVTVIAGLLASVSAGELTGNFYVGDASGGASTYTKLAAQMPSVIGNTVQVEFLSGAQDCAFSYTIMELVK